MQNAGSHPAQARFIARNIVSQKSLMNINRPGLNQALAIAGFCAETQVQDRRKDFSPAQEAEYMYTLQGYMVGTPERCQSEIADLAKAFATDEMAIVTVTYDIFHELKVIAG